MASGSGVGVLVAAMAFGAACAHGSGRAASDRPVLGVGQYQVESIRSRATLEGVERMVEITESGTRVVDSSGAEHVLSERGALTLSSEGACRLALAVSVDGDEPGISDRACVWELKDDVFLLGDGRPDGARTAYRVRRMGERLVLEGMRDLGPAGEDVGDASGERIVLVMRNPARAQQPLDPVTEQSHPSDGPTLTKDL
jgi:hypothetical protein